jgi:hypothetical protein
MNACGHLCFGLGALIKPEDALVRDFECQGMAKPVSTLTDLPLIVLATDTAAQLQALVGSVGQRDDVLCRVFFEVFFSGAVEDQVAAVSSRTAAEHEIAVVALFGSKSALAKLTKGMHLYGSQVQ